MTPSTWHFKYFIFQYGCCFISIIVCPSFDKPVFSKFPSAISICLNHSIYNIFICIKVDSIFTRNTHLLYKNLGPSRFTHFSPLCPLFSDFFPFLYGGIQLFGSMSLRVNYPKIQTFKRKNKRHQGVIWFNRPVPKFDEFYNNRNQNIDVHWSAESS